MAGLTPLSRCPSTTAPCKPCRPWRINTAGRDRSFQIEESKARDQVELQKAKNNAAKDLNDLEWHTLPASDVAMRLTTTPSGGLSSDQVKRRQQEYGRNAPSPPETHWIKTIFGYFFKGFGGILLGGAILVFVSWKPLGKPPAPANLVRRSSA